MSKAKKVVPVLNAELVSCSIRIKPTDIYCFDLKNESRRNYSVVGLTGAGKTTLQSEVMKMVKRKG